VPDSWKEELADEVAAARGEAKEAEGAKPNGLDRSYVIGLLSGAAWLNRDIPEPDFMLGELLSTTTRMEIIGPTGLGKTNVMLGTAMALADGRDFLHWRGSGKPRGVLFIDDVLEEHDPPHIPDRHRMADHGGARAGERFEEMLPSLAHLADAACAPPHMGLRVDEDRRAGRSAIGDPLSRDPVDALLGGRKTVRLAMPEGEGRGAAREPK
jgi:hypothetical protein